MAEMMTLTQALQIAKGLTGHHPSGAVSDEAWKVIAARKLTAQQVAAIRWQRPQLHIVRNDASRVL